jgi:outer membrane protein assembly factor BamB
MGSGPGGSGGPTGGPNRRNILLAAGGAVVVVGGGVGIAVAASGGGGKPTPNPTTGPSSTTSSPGPNPSTAPTSPTAPLPPAPGPVGTFAGPQAKPAWTGTLNEASSSLQLSGNTLVNKGDSAVSGYDAATGKSKWAKSFPVQDGGMLVVGQTAYIGGDLVSDSGGTEGLFAVDAAAGTESWRFPITATDSIVSSIAGVLNDVVFVQGSDDAGKWVWALDAKAHKLLWRVTGKEADGAVHVPASGTKMFIATQTRDAPYTGQIQQYDVATGAKGWALSVPKGPLFNPDSAASLVMGDGSLIYLADQAYAVDPATDKQNWAFTPAGVDLPNGWPAISPDGNLLILTATSTVFAVDAKTGQQKWKTSLPDASTQSLKQMESGVPQVADGNVYIEDSKNTIWALDVATGATRWQFNFPVEPQWVAGGGYVYAAYGTALTAIKAAGQ